MNNDSSRQIKIGAILSYFIFFFNIVCGLLYTPWMIRKIGTEDYGLYILVTTFLHYFVVDFGIWQAVTKILSRKRAEGDEEGVKKVLGITTKLYLALDLVVICVLLIVYPNIERLFPNLSPEQIVSFKNVFMIAAVFSVLSFPFGFVKGVFVSYEYYIQTKVFELLLKVFIILFTVIALSLGGGLYALVLCYGLAPFIINVSRVVYLWRKGLRVNIRAKGKEILKELFTVSGWVLLIVFSELFINNIAPSILAARSTIIQVSIFGIGLTIYNYFYSFAMSINGLFLPRVTEYRVKGEYSQIHSLALRVGRIQCILLGAVLGGFITCGVDFLTLWLGPDFHQSYFVAMIIMCPMMIIAMLHIETVNLFVSDLVKYQAISMFLTAALSVSLALTLTPSLGAIGAAIAIGTANSIFMICLMLHYYKKYLGFSLGDYFKKVLPVILVLVISTVIVLVTRRFVTVDNTLLSFVINAVIFIFLYCLMMSFVLNQYEKDSLKKILNKFKIK